MVTKSLRLSKEEKELLTAKQLRVLKLFLEDDFTISHIGRILGVTCEAVFSMLQRAEHRLGVVIVREKRLVKRAPINIVQKEVEDPNGV